MSYCPYRKIARKALVDYWVVPSDEDAKSFMQEQTIEKLEELIGAKPSIEPVIQKLATELNLTEEEIAEFVNAVYGLTVDTNGNVTESVELTDIHMSTFKMVAEKAQTVKKPVELILDVLFTVHDSWVSRSSGKFADPKRVSRKFQHLQTELIGWEEAEKDLDFILPIAEACGIKVDMTRLRTAYTNRVKEFLIEHKITTTEELADYIMQASYPYLTLGVNTPRDEQEAM